MSVAFVVPTFILILEAVVRHRKHAPILQVLIWVSFFWVAPWYIFFNLPGALVMSVGGFLPVSAVTEMSIFLTLILNGKLVRGWISTWLNQPHEDT